MPFTQKQLDDYDDTFGCCPYCGSCDVYPSDKCDFEDINRTGMTYQRIGGCNECKKEWKEIFELDRIEEITDDYIL